MNKNRLLLTLICAGSAFASQAQSQLDYGKDYIGNPIERPYIHLDLLRDSHPFILHQVRQNLTSTNWDNFRRYHSEKNASSQFTKLGIDVWNAASSEWDDQMSFNYSFTLNGANKFQQIKNARNGTATPNITDVRQSFNYDINNNLTEVIEEQAPSGTSNYTVVSRRFMDYDSQNRRIFDSASYNVFNYTTRYSYTDDTVITTVSKFVYGATKQIDTGYIQKNTAGNVLSTYRIFYDNNGIRICDSLIYTYDANNRVLGFRSMEQQSPGSIWEPVEKIEHVYRTDGQLLDWVRFIQSSKDSSAFEPDYKLNIIYGNDNEADSAFAYFWMGTAFDTKAEQRYIFKDPSLSVANFQKNNQILTVFPNPASDKLYVKGNSGVIKEIRIFDIAGRQLQYHRTTINELDIREMQAGVYLISIDGQKAIKFEKK